MVDTTGSDISITLAFQRRFIYREILSVSLAIRKRHSKRPHFNRLFLKKSVENENYAKIW